MEKIVTRNGVQFPVTKLKIIYGKVPQSICGSYLKNGPATLKLGENVLSHWFYGNGGLLKVQIKNGQCWAKYKFLQTPKYKIQMETKDFNISGLFGSIVKRICNKSKNQQNPANTNILRLKGSKDLFALFEGGLPFRVSQRNLQSYDFEDLGFIKSTFSAHPKIDPINQDVFNIGFKLDKLQIYRLSSDMKLLAQTQVQLRAMQNIHDCCLAGDYFIVFECPATWGKLKLLTGYTVLESWYIDYEYGKNQIWIFSKQDLKLVKKVQYVGEPFFMFHFTNGYSDKEKIVLEYVKYSGDNAQKILDHVLNVPQITVDNFKNNGVFSELQNLEISLKDFSLKSKCYDYDCEFPVCEQSQVGNNWRYTYFIAKQKGDAFVKFNTIVKFDRSTEKSIEHTFKESVIGQPALLRTKEGLFILILVTKRQTQKSYISILSGQSLTLIAQIQLPQLVPFGFHGIWKDAQDESQLQCNDLK